MKMISLEALFDLMDRLKKDFSWAGLSELRSVVEWASDHELIGKADVGLPTARDVRGILRANPPSPYPPAPSMAEVNQIWTKISEIPPGPQTAPEGQPAPDLNVADASEADQGPEGAEAPVPVADDAPVPPDAGGGTSDAQAGPPDAGGGTSDAKTPPPDAGGGTSVSANPPRWTPEEDARAIELRNGGKTVAEVAALLGRPVKGTRYRFVSRLNAMMETTREERKAAQRASVNIPGEVKAPSLSTDRAAPSGLHLDGPQTVAAPIPAFDPSRPLWFRQIEAVLNAIGHKTPWTPALDLELVEGLAMGRKLAEIAADLKIDPAKVKERFIALTPAGRPSIEDQKRLLDVLRARARPADAQAAE